MNNKYHLTIIFIICALCFYNKSSANDSDNDSTLLSSIESFDTNTVNHLLDLTRKLSSDKADSAKIYGQKALLLSKAINFKVGIHKAYTRLAVVDYYQNDYEAALLNIEKVKENLTDDYEGKNTLTSTLLLEGTIYKYKGNYSKAISILDSAKSISKDLKNYHFYTLATNNIANIHRKQGRHKDALESYFEVLKSIKGNGLDKDEALTLGNIGILYKEQEDYEQALAYYEKALVIYEKTHDNRSISRVLNNLGNIYFSQRNYEKALEIHQSALNIRQGLNDIKGIAISLINIGDIYLETQTYDKALSNVNESIKLNKEINNKEIELSAKILRSKIYLGKKNYSEAVDNAKTTLNLAIDLNDILQQQIAYQVLSTAFKGKKDYKNALYYFEKEQIIKDSLSSYNREKIDELTNKYIFEQQEKTILNQELKIAQNEVNIKNNRLIFASVSFLFSLFSIIAFFYIRNKRNVNRNLQQKNIEINQQNQDLRNTQNNLKAANQDLESFTQMASHDLKEPLRVMGNFAQLLKRRNKNLDESSQEYIDYITSAAKRMNQMLNDMLAYATQDIVIENMVVFPLGNIISTVKKDLHFSIREHKAQITVHNELPKIKGQESLILQVFQNIISNAIKYKKPDVKPEINIYASENEHDVMVTIADNGVGIAPENQARAFELFQRFDESQRGSGIGLATCQKIIKLHNGSIQLESELNKGSKFILTFPKN